MVALIGGYWFGCTSDDLVDFNREVRPILNENCLGCHGGVKQLGDLSFLFETDAKDRVESGGYAIVPGQPKQSLLLERIKHENPEIRMPPEGPGLSGEEIDILERWVRQGANWETHWAYRQLPDIQSFGAVSIDYYINKGLDEKKLQSAPIAQKETLLRRLSLDLIGLPPSMEEVDAFINDSSENAIEIQVDRLLASPHFGERWAAMWMDLARYGDSQGYQKDPYRSIWRYRDWLIDAFNSNMPFDQFTIEQLAGDHLNDADEDQLLATAFHRNTMTNDEGGTDDEEFRVAAVLDRVSTTWEVWQGTSMACVQCHSHPYDPFVHEDFYQLYAFFNNTKDADTRFDKPLLHTYGKIERAKIIEIAGANGLEIREKGIGSKALDSLKNALLELQDLGEADRDALEKVELVPTPIMQDFPTDSMRQSFVFERGNWLVHGAEMHPNVPGSMPPLNKDNATRLDLAEWLVSESNPLTARVIVNRFWANLFGAGLVTTLEDFGTMGSKPSHPDLLDWLAVTFRQELDWNMKGLLKLMVMSETYQRSSFATEEQLNVDPENILLAHMPRRRLSAEQIRDQALQVSGLLSEKMYGPSVMPPQPDGVWQVIRNVMRWKESEGEDRYRRALYTFWRKSSPYPSFMSFDSPSKEFCLSRRITTNTPLQALVTLNDTVYVEAAEALAKSSCEKNTGAVKDCIEQMYRSALAKKPSARAVDVLERQYWSSHNLLNEKMSGDIELEKSADHLDVKAMTTVANVIMNLDEYLVIE